MEPRLGAVSWLLSALFMGAVLAGCASPQLAIHKIPGDVQGFEATLSSSKSGRWFNYSLDGPVEIHVGPGKSMKAYRLIESVAGREKVRAFFLDASLHVVRVDETCSSPDEGDCAEFQLADFEAAGRLPPAGILWLQAYRTNGALNIPLSWMTVDLAARVTGGSQQWNLEAHGDPATNDAFQDEDWPGSYTYRDQALVPAHGPKFDLVTIHVGSILPLADAYTWIPSPISTTEVPFGGAGTDPFGMGMTIRQVWEALLSQSPEAASDWNNHHCLLGFDSEPFRVTNGPLLPPPPPETDVVFRLGNGETTQNNYSMHVISRSLLQPATASFRGRETGDAVTHCRERQTAPNASYSILDGEEYRKQAAPSGLLNIVELQTGRSVLPGRPISSGWNTYWFYMTPKSREASNSGGVSHGYLYLLIMDATTGRPLALQTHPDDFEPGTIHPNGL